MLSKNDIKTIKDIVGSSITEAIAPLARKMDLGFANLEGGQSKLETGLAKLETRLVSHEVKSDANFTKLERKMDKHTRQLQKAIAREHKLRREDFNYLEQEDKKIIHRVTRIENHLQLAPAT